ncbi:metallophosphoesterase family protein [Paenibacillus sp. Marseille-Q4541]|uniref:metallophosphoesterase family protein n=1 Tax=Paenibacillus sp. Marseille-Q4541 TaxID=2831522 RepID=UPI001BA6DEFB|nr:metallophosphoesterase family protein [Paenibacillus sp. Marseille-Q4541]
MNSTHCSSIPLKGVLGIRTIVISDLHGCYDEFNALLRKVKYQPEQDQLILLGDYVDRGPRSKEVVDQIMQLQREHGIVVIRGNHDQLFLDAILKNEDARWIRNGARQTLESYCEISLSPEQLDQATYEEAKAYIKTHFSHHLEFLTSLPYYYETDTHLFVHAGINPFYTDFKDQPEDDFIWIREMFHDQATHLDKMVVFGHTPTLHLHERADIWFQDDKIGIDGACAYGKQLNALEIMEDGSYRAYMIPAGTVAVSSETIT